MQADFTWHVPQYGFEWICNEEEEDYLLAPCPVTIEPKKKGRPRLPTFTYSPLLEYTGLFGTFANLPLSTDGILQFANKYGSLDEMSPLLIRDRQEPTVGIAIGRGGRFKHWCREIVAMQKAIDLWNGVKGQNREELQRHIAWSRDAQDGPMVHYHSHPECDTAELAIMEAEREEAFEILIASNSVNKDWLEKMTPQNTILAARLALKQLIEEKLEQGLSSKMIIKPDGQDLAWSFVPANLKTAMWLQFARAVTEKLQYHCCPVCKMCFELSPPIVRNTRLFCSDACKSRGYRQKQDRARQLFAQKKTFPEIARELDSDVSKVRRWITGQR